MIPRAVVLGLGAMLVAATACQPVQPAELTALDQQVAWGGSIYAFECAYCHAPNRSAPPIIGESLLQYEHAGDLFDFIRETMPFDDPGRLGDQEYWDVTAYLLRREGLLQLPADETLDAGNAEAVDFVPPAQGEAAP